MLKSPTAGLSKRWRLRLKAGALAFAFSFLSLLPWAHVLTLDARHGHGCCHHGSAEPTADGAPAAIAEVAATPDACWVCGSLASLLHSTVLSDAQALVRAAPSSDYAARAPHAPSVSHIDPASRSQAPPAQA